MDYVDTKTVGDRLMVRSQCPVCSIWMWGWADATGLRCGICKGRDLSPGDQLVQPPPVEVWVLE